MLFDVQDREMSKCKRKPNQPLSCVLCMVVRLLGGPVSYILEATVKDLQLFAGETCLGFKLFQALGAMADCR